MIRDVLARTLPFVVVGLMFSPSLSAREHEHLPYFFGAQDFEKAIGQPVESLRVNELFKDSKSLGFTGKDLNLPQEALANVAPDEPIGPVLERAYEALRQTKPNLPALSGRELALQLFETKTWINIGAADPINVYRDVEGVRKNAIKTLLGKRGDPKAISRMFLEYLGRQYATDRGKIAFSLPHEYAVDPVMGEALRQLQQQVKGKISKISYLYSAARGTAFNAEEMRNMIGRIREGGWISGIDISGSLREGPAPAKMSPQKLENAYKGYRGAFEELFKGSAGLEVRVHAFEGMPTGAMASDPFYKAMLDSLRATPVEALKGSKFRVGHMATLDWNAEGGKQNYVHQLMDELDKKFGRGNVILEANIRSNEVTHGFDQKILARNIQESLDRGWTVVLGSDGLGMLSENEFYATLSNLNRAQENGKFILSDAQMVQLIDQTAHFGGEGKMAERERLILKKMTSASRAACH